MPKKLAPRGQAAPPVEPNVAQASIPKQQPPKKAPVKRKVVPGSKYVYNLRGIECRVTLTTKREIRLQPRGQRGDLDIVTTDEQDDPLLLANLGVIFDLIDPEEAHKIIANQRVDAKNLEHPAMAALRNEQGKPYEQQSPTVEAAFEQQGITVAKVESAPDGRNTERNVEVQRTGPQITSVPGSVGHPATDVVTGEITMAEYEEFLQWKRFKAAVEAQAATPDDLRDSVKIEDLQTEDDEVPEA